jgi:tRNA(adenine34) deaminase
LPPLPYRSFMQIALDEAARAARAGEVPVGAVVVKDDEVIATGRNRTLEWHDPTAHAEIVALREAGRVLGSERLIGCDLWVTLEPCPMCAGAISFARVRRLYYGAADPKGGAVDNGVRLYASPSCHHTPEVYPGIGEGEAGEMLKGFFRDRR